MLFFYTMKKYEFFEHTADVKFKAYGNSLEEAYKNSALAFYNVMTDITKLKPASTLEIEVSSNTYEALLYDFLTELIFYVDTEGFLGCEVSSLQITKKEKNLLLKAKIKGTYIKNIEEAEVYSYVKSMTYNELIIDKKTNTIQVVLDI